MDLTVVVPCFNESDNVDLLSAELMPVLRTLQQDRSVELIFVDDGSTDGTGDLLESSVASSYGARVVRHEVNRGLGAALRTGFYHATGEVVVTTDSDATYSFSLISPLIELLRADTHIVTASCYHPGGGVDNVPGYRVFLSKSASMIYRVLLDRRIFTYTCMFRAYRREVIETVPFHSNGFLSVTEILANAIRMGYSVTELPCRLRARRYGASKAKVARIIASHLRFQGHLLAGGVSGMRRSLAVK